MDGYLLESATTIVIGLFINRFEFGVPYKMPSTKVQHYPDLTVSSFNFEKQKMNDGANKFCSLCGLPVHVVGFTLKLVTGEEKSFCCEGCKSIYKMINYEIIKTC